MRGVLGVGVDGVLSWFFELLLLLFLLSYMLECQVLKGFGQLLLIEFAEEEEVVEGGELDDSFLELVDEGYFLGLGQQSGGEVDPVPDFDVFELYQQHPKVDLPLQIDLPTLNHTRLRHIRAI